MSEGLPGVLQTGVSEDHRPGKLHRQTEIENDSTSAAPVTSPMTVTTPEASTGLSPSSTQSRGTFSDGIPNDSLKKTMPSFSNRKTTLSRGHALEGTSPPPDSIVNQMALADGETYNGQLLSSGPTGGSFDSNGKLNGQSHDAKDLLLASHTISNFCESALEENQRYMPGNISCNLLLDSGTGTFDQTDESSDTSVLSRDSSVENASIRHVYKDSTNTNIPIFFRETIRRSAKDRKTVLLLEDQLLSFINCSGAQVHKTGELTSYDRMIVHRMAAYLGLEHNVDSTGRCVILNKTENTRSVKLSEVTLFEDSGYEPKKRILLKKPVSFDEKHCRGNNKAHFGSHRAKSLEERQQNYMVARERIFKTDENQLEGEPDYKSFVPYHSQHLVQDSMKSNGHLPITHGSTDLTAEYQKNVVHTLSSSNIKPSYQSSSHMPAPVVSPTELDQTACSSIVDTGPSPIAQMQPHVNQDGSLYQFDPTCPPPFMMQLASRPPMATPPPSHIVYQNDGVSDITTRFATASVGTLEQCSESFAAGVLNQPVPIFVPQSMYTPVYPSQFMQGQYFVASAPTATQPSVRYITLPPGQCQQVLQGTAMDSQGQVTVPMPPLGVPSVPNGSFQMVGSPYQLTMALAQPPGSVDHNSVTYHYGPVPEAMMMAGTSGLNTSLPGRATGTQQLFLAFPQPQPVQQQAQFTPAGSTPQGTYYSIPATTPTPPLSLAQPPPASHHQQQPPPAVFFTGSIGNPLTYPVSMPDPSSPSASSLRPVLTPFLQTQYISQHPKQQQLHPHHPQPVLISPQNGHHPAPMTVNCSQPVPYNPGQPLSQVTAAQGQLLEAVQNPYQVRPIGATLFHLAGNPVIQASHLGANPHLQSYQFFRPAGTDVRLVNPSSVRSRLSPLQITNTSTPRPRYNCQYRHPKKWGKKLPNDVEGYQIGQGPSTSQQTSHMNIIAPLGMSGSIPVPHPHIQPGPHRQ